MDLQQILNYMNHLRVSQTDPKGRGAIGMKPDTRRSHKFPSNLLVEVKKGDLTKENVDAIVNAANSHLNHISGLAGAIVRAGGDVIQIESTQYVRTHERLSEGDVVVTSSGRLQESNGIKAVFHAVGPIFPLHSGRKDLDEIVLQEDKELYACIWNSLLEAEQRGYKSIAIPAVSSGIFGFPKDRCARILFDALEDFIKEGTQKEGGMSLEYVAFTNFDDLTVEVFKEEFDRRQYVEEGGAEDAESGEGNSEQQQEEEVEGGSQSEQQ